MKGTCLFRFPPESSKLGELREVKGAATFICSLFLDTDGMVKIMETPPVNLGRALDPDRFISITVIDC